MRAGHVILAAWIILSGCDSNQQPGRRPAEPLAKAKPPEKWTYSEDVDQIRGVTTRSLCTLSIEQTEPGSAYPSQNVQLCDIRRSDKKDALVISLPRGGQIICDPRGCELPARFDGQKPSSIWVDRPPDGSTNLLVGRLIGEELAFDIAAAKAKTLRMELTLYQAGSQQFSFDLDGLDWTKHPGA